MSSDLAHLRKDIVDHMGVVEARRVLEYKSVDTDEVRAFEAVAHYRAHAQKTLKWALYPHWHLYYITFHQAERMTVLLTGFGASAGLGKWMYKQRQALKAAGKNV